MSVYLDSSSKVFSQHRKETWQVFFNSCNQFFHACILVYIKLLAFIKLVCRIIRNHFMTLYEILAWTDKKAKTSDLNI